LPAGVPACCARGTVTRLGRTPDYSLRFGNYNLGKRLHFHKGTLRGTVRPVIIAIDGPSGVGKSTLGRALAARLGCAFVESGAMYRAVALLALENHAAPEDAAAVIALAERAEIRFAETASGMRVRLKGRDMLERDVTERIRAADVTDAASIVSTIPRVRELLVARQRALGSSPVGVVMEGRDIGTVVFPNADLKIYLDAAPDIRTTRRLQDGENVEPTSESVLREQIETRDSRDRTRRASPLVAAPDAVRLDTSQLTAEEVLNTVWAMIQSKAAGSDF